MIRGSFIGRGETHLCIYSCPGYKCCKTGSYRHLLDRLERSKQAFSLILGVDPRPDKRLSDGNVGKIFQTIKVVKWSQVEIKWQQQNKTKNLLVYLLYTSSTTNQVNPLFEREQLKLYSCPFLSLRSSNSDPWDLPPTLATSVPGRPHNTGTASRKCLASVSYG